MKKREILKKNDLSFIDKMTNQEKMEVKGGKTSASAETAKIKGISIAVNF